MKIRNLPRVFALAAVLALCCGAIPTAFAAQNGTREPLPDSVLYYGRVEAISHNGDGEITALHLSSDRYGEYVMRISEDTVWIDSGNRTASDPATLKEGEGLYVFHSPRTTRYLPPPTAPVAIVRNINHEADGAH